MDLLGGYDSEDSSHASVSQGPPGVPVASAAVAVAAAVIPQAAAIATTDSSKLFNNDKTVQNKNQEQQRKRGKKLLKLQSVLPQHIWNQLTASSATTAGTSSSLDLGDDDDDEDEMDDSDAVRSNNLRRTNSSHTKPPVASSLPNNSSTQKGHSSSLLDLLNSLPTSSKQKQGTSSILATAATVPSSSTIPTTTATSHSPRPVPPSPSPQMVAPFSGLGGAFLTSTVQVTRTKKGEQKIRSIHSPVDNNEHSNDKPSTVCSLKPGHSTTHENSSHTTVLSFKESDHQAHPSRLPPALQSVLRPSLSYLAPYAGFSMSSATARSATSRRSAAPPVRATGAPSMATYPTPLDQEEEDGTTQPMSQENHRQHLPRAAAVPLSNKARKKQMEAMLRAGNLDEIDSDIHLTGGGNANYAAQALLQQQQQQATAQYQAHGVRVVPTSQYNPSTGQMDASASISGKQKGKNQLNALLANAASLEASRLDNPQLSNNPRGTYRNNAKRKYGW